MKKNLHEVKYYSLYSCDSNDRELPKGIVRKMTIKSKYKVGKIEGELTL